MSVDVWTDADNDHQGLYCNTSDWCFGPIFPYFDENMNAHTFMDWCDNTSQPDARTLTESELSTLICEFKDRYIEQDRISFSEVCDVVIEGVDTKHHDYPDYCDAYFGEAYWKTGQYAGRELSEGELESLTEQNGDELNEMAHESVQGE